MKNFDELFLNIKKHRILIAHPQRFVGSCISKILEETGLDVLKGIEDKEQCIFQNQMWKPPYILISEIYFDEKLKTDNPMAKIIILTENKDMEFIHNVRNYVNSLIHTDDAFDSIYEAFRAINSKEFYFSKIFRDYLEKFQITFEDKTNLKDKIKLLSKREKEVLSHLAEGSNGKIVGKTLFISHQTLMTHKLNIADKLSLEGGRKSLTKFAILNRHLIL